MRGSLVCLENAIREKVVREGVRTPRFHYFSPSCHRSRVVPFETELVCSGGQNPVGRPSGARVRSFYQRLLENNQHVEFVFGSLHRFAFVHMQTLQKPRGAGRLTHLEVACGRGAGCADGISPGRMTSLCSMSSFGRCPGEK